MNHSQTHDSFFKTTKKEKEIEYDLEIDKKFNDFFTSHKPDSIVTSILYKFLERSKMGKLKYGTDLDRTDLTLYDWIVHAQDEHMDAILYLEKIKQLIVKK